MSFRWIGNQVLPQFDFLKSKEALLEVEIPPHVELQKENNPNVIFDSEMVYKIFFDLFNKKGLLERSIQPCK